MEKVTTGKSTFHFGVLGRAYTVFGALLLIGAVVIAGVFSLMPDYPPIILLILILTGVAAGLMLKTGFGMLSKKPWARTWAIAFAAVLIFFGMASLLQSKSVPVKSIPALIELVLGAYGLWVMLRSGALEAWNSYVSGNEHFE